MHPRTRLAARVADALASCTRKARKPLLAALAASTFVGGLAPIPAEAGGLIGDGLRAVGLKRLGDDVDRESATFKKKVKVYGAIEEGGSRMVRETFRWIQRHPGDALMIALVVATAGAACADGCTVVFYYVSTEAAASGASALAIPIAVYQGDRKDRAAASSGATESGGGQGGSPRKADAEKPAAARTTEDVKTRLTVLEKPVLGALPQDPKRYTVVPGLPDYRRLLPHERQELAANRDAAKDMSAANWIGKVWSGSDWDYKSRPGWGSPYATFGNINYGLTGSQVVGSDRLLYTGGGLAQQLFSSSRKIYDPKNGSFVDFFDISKPDDSLFGDMPEDHAAVKAGIQINRSFDLIRTLEGESAFGLKLPDAPGNPQPPAPAENAQKGTRQPPGAIESPKPNRRPPTAVDAPPLDPLDLQLR